MHVYLQLWGGRDNDWWTTLNGEGKREGRKTHDSRHFVRNELGWVIAIPILHQKVISQRPRQY